MKGPSKVFGESFFFRAKVGKFADDTKEENDFPCVSVFQYSLLLLQIFIVDSVDAERKKNK